MSKKKPRFKLKKKLSPKPSKAFERLKHNVGQQPVEYKEELTGTVEARRESEVKFKTAEATLNSELAKANRETVSTEYVDENGKSISKKQLKLLQDTVASFYENFVVLTPDQIKDLQVKLPKKMNNSVVKVGSKAVYPPVLDTERKKVSRGRVIEKAHRLRYIESESGRGLKMPEDIEGMLTESKKSKKYEESRRARKDLVRTLISLNYNDHEMCEYLYIDVKELSRLKKEVYFEELSVHRQMTNEELFVQYKLQQMEVVKDLDVIVERFKGSKQLTALAGALKAKSEIYNDIINKGYEFGVIDKTPDKAALLVGNLDITSASLSDLRSEMVKNNDEMQKIVNSDNFLLEDDDDGG